MVSGVGLRATSSNLSERMQMEAGLTLEKAKKIRQRETVKEQGQLLVSGNKPQLDAGQPRKPKKKVSKTTQREMQTMWERIPSGATMPRKERNLP